LHLDDLAVVKAGGHDAAEAALIRSAVGSAICSPWLISRVT
jgi:hypothetical protein